MSVQPIFKTIELSSFHTSPPKHQNLPSPFGYTPHAIENRTNDPLYSANEINTTRSTATLSIDAIQKRQSMASSKAWGSTLAPFQSKFTSFIMFFFLRGEKIFSTLFVVYGINSTFQSLFGVSKTFEPLYDLANRNCPEEKKISLMPQKIVFFLVTLVTLCVEIYLCSVNGIIPIKSGDFTRLIPMTHFSETTTGFIK